MQILACVLGPLFHRSLARCCSSLRAHSILRASSKRAFNSTIAVTYFRRVRPALTPHDRAVGLVRYQRLLDRQHIGIDGGFLDQSHDRRKGFVRVVEHNVPLGDRGEHAFAGRSVGASAAESTPDFSGCRTRRRRTVEQTPTVDRAGSQEYIAIVEVKRCRRKSTIVALA